MATAAQRKVSKKDEKTDSHHYHPKEDSAEQVRTPHQRRLSRHDSDQHQHGNLEDHQHGSAPSRSKKHNLKDGNHDGSDAEHTAAKDDHSTVHESFIPPQITETCIAALIRLKGRLGDLREMINLFEDFDAVCTNPAVYLELSRYYHHQITVSINHVYLAWEEVQGLRYDGQGTKHETPAGIEETSRKVLEGDMKWRKMRKLAKQMQVRAENTDENGARQVKKGKAVEVHDNKDQRKGTGAKEARLRLSDEEMVGLLKAHVNMIRAGLACQGDGIEPATKEIETMKACLRGSVVDDCEHWQQSERDKHGEMASQD